MVSFCVNDEMNDGSDSGFDPRLNGWRIKQRHWHFHEQLFRRYGVVLEHGEFTELSRDIRAGRAELIERQPRRRAIYAVLLTRCWRHVFLVTKGEEIVTALPRTPRLMRKWRRLSDR